ncbi:hypothetical protein C8Q77DRAFT_1133682 [Trametes polyzona]|nr:hypothetical protein C8Q77DRAFT_1133682 [Trametes polyzona]
MDEVITKRIHISGLTPAITAKDLSDRLGSFGTVKALDGFGAVDALGQPRKFAYATLETTKGKLARCMNLLSGVTWKGAKLRLGEAKPDFRERIAQEHEKLKRAAEEAANQPPKKRRRLPRGVQGVHASDMSLVTPENAPTRGGWRVTATGRLIRPIRMRPDHPLPEPIDAPKLEKGKGKDKGKGKKRARDPPTRARRRTIDPTKWGSTHLKGIFLENAAASVLPQRSTPAQPPVGDSESDEDDQEGRAVSESEVDSGSDTESESGPDSPTEVNAPSKPPATTVAPPKPKTQPDAAASNEANDLAEETSKALGLLQSLFGDKDEWGGEESVGSDVDEEDLRRAREEVQMASVPEESDHAGGDDDVMEVDEPTSEASKNVAVDIPGQAPAPGKTKLKDLFAPREEEAGFSLLGHLDLDLELEDDLPFDLPTAAPAPAAPEPLRPIQPTLPIHASRVAALDPSKPLFFPSDNAPSKRSALDPTNWRTWFYRTDTADAIRQRWEESKGELTAGWKRRHREAIKSRRRRGGGAGEAD